MKKIWIIAVALVVSSFLGWKIYERASTSGTEPRHGRGKPPTAVEVTRVQKGDIRDMATFTGSLYPAAEFIVAPKIAGRLEKILVHIGDEIEPGQLVASLESEEYFQQLKQTEAEQEVARATVQERMDSLENAGREYERTTVLRERKIASASQLDAADAELKSRRAGLKVAEAQVIQKEAAFNAAKVRLSYARIHMPQALNGNHWVVGERFVHEGALLSPNTPIVSVLDIGMLIAVVHVIERDYARIELGLRAEISTDAFPGRGFHGTVLRIAPLLQEKSRHARVEIEIPNETLHLRPGMFVRAGIEIERHADALVIPIAAIAKRNDREGVFLLDSEKKTVSFVPVEMGIVSGSMAQVLSPELEGWVVTLGHHLLEDGANVILPEEKLSRTPLRGMERPGRADAKVSGELFA